MQRPNENAAAGGIVLPFGGCAGGIAGELDVGVQLRFGALGAGQIRLDQFGGSELSGAKRGLCLGNGQIGGIAIEPGHERDPVHALPGRIVDRRGIDALQIERVDIGYEGDQVVDTGFQRIFVWQDLHPEDRCIADQRRAFRFMLLHCLLHRVSPLRGAIPKSAREDPRQGSSRDRCCRHRTTQSATHRSPVTGSVRLSSTLWNYSSSGRSSHVRVGKSFASPSIAYCTCETFRRRIDDESTHAVARLSAQ